MRDTEDHRQRRGACPAASAKSVVGACGARDIVPSACMAVSGASRPAPRSLTARIAEATRSMFTPVGSAGTEVSRLPPFSSARSSSSPQRGMIVARFPTSGRLPPQRRQSAQWPAR
jgi:hypothetical protein